MGHIGRFGMRDVFMLPSAVAEVLQPDSNPSKETNNAAKTVQQVESGKRRQEPYLPCCGAVLCVKSKARQRNGVKSL